MQQHLLCLDSTRTVGRSVAPGSTAPRHAASLPSAFSSQWSCVSRMKVQCFIENREAMQVTPECLAVDCCPFPVSEVTASDWMTGAASQFLRSPLTIQHLKETGIIYLPSLERGHAANATNHTLFNLTEHFNSHTLVHTRWQSVGVYK
jgi:hypothetical protein